jgi:hypothetical protein
MSEKHAPFRTLGTHLKYLREQSKESLGEVSGAVEIDEVKLSKIEEGHLRPEEDILLLLISHFSMPDQEAVQLWELAGYGGAPETIKHADVVPEEIQKTIVMLMPNDPRAVYSDGLDILCNQAGVTLHFTQESSKSNQPHSISKVGMSYEQAERVYQALQYALIKALKAYRQQYRRTNKIVEKSSVFFTITD